MRIDMIAKIEKQITEKEEELEALKDRLELLDLDEPDDVYSEEHDDWEDIRRGLTEAIEDLEEEIRETD